jgi:hypothetical protein
MKDFKISEHFTFFELTKTRDFPNLLDENREYFAKEPYISRLTVACEYLLENIRIEIDKPIIVNNGGRFPALNEAVGGVWNSQHLFGGFQDGAFDFYCPQMSVAELGKYITDQSNLNWHQLRIYLSQNFIHLGMPLGHNDGQVTVIK